MEQQHAGDDQEAPVVEVGVGRDQARAQGLTMRQAASLIAVAKVSEAIRLRGFV